MADAAQGRKMKAIQSWHRGYSVTEIAAHMGLSRRTIQDYVRGVERGPARPKPKNTKMKVDVSKIKAMIELGQTNTREQVAELLEISPHTAKKYESRVREFPEHRDFVCASICPSCNRLIPPKERYQRKTSRSLFCVPCYIKAHPNADPERIRTRNSKIGVTDPLPGDTMTMSVRRKLKSQIPWTHGSFSSLSPAYSGLPDGWYS